MSKLQSGGSTRMIPFEHSRKARKMSTREIKSYANCCQACGSHNDPEFVSVHTYRGRDTPAEAPLVAGVRRRSRVFLTICP